LLDASGDTSGKKSDRVNADLERQLKFLLAGEGRCVRNVVDVEVGEDADDALFYLGADLLLGQVFLCDGIDA
jgi:hypothetical protein